MYTQNTGDSFDSIRWIFWRADKNRKIRGSVDSIHRTGQGQPRRGVKGVFDPPRGVALTPQVQVREPLTPLRRFEHGGLGPFVPNVWATRAPKNFGGYRRDFFF